MSRRSDTVLRVGAALPPDWYPVRLDDVDAWVDELLARFAPGAPDTARSDLSGDVVGALGVMDLAGTGTSFVYVSGDRTGPRIAAQLLVGRWPHRRPRSRWTEWCGRELVRELEASKAEDPAVSTLVLPVGHAVRSRTLIDDDLGDRVEAVSYLLAAETEPYPHWLRLQWRPRDPRAGGFAGIADDLARRATLGEATP